MYSLTKKGKKLSPWKNPDFYIALSFLSYFLFAIMLFVAPHVVSFFHGGQKAAQVITLFLLFAGALFSGLGNWFGFGYESYPGEGPSKELLQELDAMLEERKRQLREESGEEI